MCYIIFPILINIILYHSSQNKIKPFFYLSRFIHYTFSFNNIVNNRRPDKIVFQNIAQHYFHNLSLTHLHLK